MVNKVLCIFHNSKIANTDHLSYMFSAVHNSIQKFTNISIIKPIIFISITNKYLDNLNYLDNCTALVSRQIQHKHSASPCAVFVSQHTPRAIFFTDVQ